MKIGSLLLQSDTAIFLSLAINNCWGRTNTHCPDELQKTNKNKTKPLSKLELWDGTCQHFWNDFDLVDTVRKRMNPLPVFFDTWSQKVLWNVSSQPARSPHLPADRPLSAFVCDWTELADKSRSGPQLWCTQRQKYQFPTMTHCEVLADTWLTTWEEGTNIKCIR